jgi:hypothetical protein
MMEPELLPVIATWLPGWGQNPRSSAEAMVTLPRQRWRTDGIGLIIELQPPNEKGRTVAWISAGLPGEQGGQCIDPWPISSLPADRRSGPAA